MKTKSNAMNRRRSSRIDRRTLLKSGLAVAATGPIIWIPDSVYSQQCEGRGGVKHLLYIRLGGGFRFTTAFNGDVGGEFNPFGVASGLPSGTEWGASSLLTGDDWRQGDPGQPLRDLGMRQVTQFADEMTVLATVDHEPEAGNADGNHGTGLERFNTGYAAGENSIFTMLHYGLRDRIELAATEGRVELPPFVLGSAGMARGGGAYAAYRPPLLQGDSFENFVFSSTELPDWANAMAEEADLSMRDRQMPASRSLVDAYMGTRESTRRFSEIFSSDILRVRNNSDEMVDGISNRQLTTMFGEGGSANQVKLALRLFHFGCPAVYLDQGGYDMHSGEDERLPDAMTELNRIISGLNAALKAMEHPDGGSYWDHTLVVLGSEFGRTARGGPFNSAGGSDHGGDRATRWMSMPFMGGLLQQRGIAGQQFGVTSKSDLEDDGVVFSYRSVAKTLMDLLCADHSEFFPQDPPIEGIF